MQFPESWLREFCNPPLSTAELADLLTMAGLEVEDTRPVAPPFDRVVVGQVLSCERHPNADKLSVCQVDVGHAGDGAAPLTIVCGAPNVRAGIKVPCAQVGARLPAAQPGSEPFVITLSTLRGVESQGMLCSARELKLSDDHGGLLVLADDAPVGQDIRQHLSLDDTLFTLKLTPNLGHALSVYGIAREVAALTGAPLRRPAVPPAVVRHPGVLKVTVEAPDLCGRFSGRIVRNVDPKAVTPGWMVERLARCGQRSVTALVDISNYVMFECGQPTHIFDADRIEGGLTVRWGRPGESLKLLNGSTVQLDAQVGVIADRRADGPAVESLAGIMGGDATAVSDATRNVYVEAAFWWPEAVAGRSRRFNFATDAGHRFERGVDPACTVACTERITQLIVDICGGEAGPLDDQTLALPDCAPVTLRVARAARVIGMPITQQQCADVFGRLGFAFTEIDGALTVTPPSWRFDLRIEEDLIEEVIRVLGFDSLPATPPRAALTPFVRSEQKRGTQAVRERLAGLGYVETINYSFVEERLEHELAGNADPIRVLNPIAGQYSVMRSSLLGGLVGVLRHNLARKAGRVRVFEAGRVFRRDPAAADGAVQVAGVDQPMRAAGLAFGPVEPVQWGVDQRNVDFFDVKGDLQVLLAPREAVFTAAAHPALHPGRCARIDVDGTLVGFVGELHPRWRQVYELPSAPVMFEIDFAALDERPLPQPLTASRQQPSLRDIALIAGPAVTHDALMAAVREASRAVADGAGASKAVALIRHVELFDIYQPAMPTADIAADERSMALRLQLLDDDATLTDERIDAAVSELLTTLQSRLGVRLRG